MIGVDSQNKFFKITNYLFLFVVSFVQNMAFTWVSRSRNLADVWKHSIASIFSNGIWFVCNYFILFPEVMKTVIEGSLWERIIIGLIYISSTTLGSVVMMKINLGHWNVLFLTEKGKSKVGSGK